MWFVWRDSGNYWLTLTIFNLTSIYPNSGYNVKRNNTFFQCSLCIWDAASKFLLPGTSDVTSFRRYYKLFTPRLSPHTPGEPAMFVLKGFSGFSWPKAPHYWKLCYIKLKKRSDVTDNNLGDPASTVFWWCNASWYMQALWERLWEQENSENSAFSVNKHKLRN